MLLQAEKPRVRDGDAPPRYKHRGPLHRLVRSMGLNDWVLVSHVQAKSIARAARQLGGSATRWQTSEMFSCVKIVSAPWMS